MRRRRCHVKRMLAVALFISLGYGLYGHEYFFVDVAQLYMAAGHDALGDIEELGH